MKNQADILSLGKPQLAEVMTQMEQPSFRAKQLFTWLHARRVGDFSEMSDLPAALRERLARDYYVASARAVRESRSRDGTVKYLFEFADGVRVETVAMEYEHGVSVCLSTQAGCRMGCVFCATGKSGFERSLSAGEILAQLYAVSALKGRRADSVVLMGMGEPLDNYDAVTRFCDIACDKDGYGLSGRGVTLSTCGLVPQMDRLAAEKRQLTLAVSLHATTDASRAALMPIARRYPLGELIPACERYFEATGRRVSFEYAVICGKNDSREDAERLAGMARRVRTHINLIPVNPAGNPRLRATRADAERFCGELRRLGANATVRRTLGEDVDAACGQLRRRDKKDGQGQ